MIGNNLDRTRASKTGVTRHVFEERLGLTDRRVVMLSDRERDAIGGRQNGLGPIAVGYGFGSAAELLVAGPYPSDSLSQGIGNAEGAAGRRVRRCCTLSRGKERAWMRSRLIHAPRCVHGAAGKDRHEH